MSGPALSKVIYLVIVGGMTIGIAFFALRNLIALAKLRGGEPSVGRIVRKRIDSDDGTYYHVTYAFEDRSGGMHQREVQLAKANYDRLQEGQPASIVYQADDPENSYLADPRIRRARFRSMCMWLLLAALLSYVIYGFVTGCVIADICPS